MDEKQQQEILFKLSMFEQQIQNIQQQLQAVEKAILDMNTLNLDLEELKGAEGKEILSSIGKGIFVKTKLISEELIVDIGGRHFVKKSIPNTQKIIKEQIEKLKEARKELNKALEEINKQMTEVMLEYQKKNK
jgi:prefoldin alpha subunit